MAHPTHQTLNVILSIHPNYAKLIYAGLKRIEFRRKLWVKPIDKIYLYETSPVQRITGYIENYSLLKGVKLPHLWSYDPHHDPGVTWDQFEAYFKGLEKGNGIKIDSVIHYTTPLDPNEVIYGWHPPQNYRYCKDDLESLPSKTYGQFNGWADFDLGLYTVKFETHLELRKERSQGEWDVLYTYPI